MKSQHGLLAAGTAGLAAGILRIVQYHLTIDRDGYYLEGALSDILSGVLIGLLAAGTAFCLICGLLQKKEQCSFSAVFGRYLPARILFLLIAVVSAADGVLRLLNRDQIGNTVAGILCLCGAIGWALLIRKETAGPVVLLPVAHLCGLVLSYFWKTYKYLQVSEYTLDLLALCAAAFFTLMLMKARAEADCSKKRLTAVACLTVLFGLAALPSGGFEITSILLSVQLFLYILLAAVTLLLLPQSREPVPAGGHAPDPATLNEYISEIEEVDDHDA